jgi:hypothetical protein
MVTARGGLSMSENKPVGANESVVKRNSRRVVAGSGAQ